MTERTDPERSGDDYIPIPEHALEQTLDTILLDTAYAIKPRDKYVFEDRDSVWYDGETGRLFVDGDSALIEPDSTELEDFDELPDIFIAKIWNRDEDGVLRQSYIADLRSLSRSIPRHEDSSVAPDEQEYFSSWEAYQKGKREIGAFLIASAESDGAEKIGDPSLFDHLDWLQSEVDIAKEAYDSRHEEDEEVIDYDEPQTRRAKMGRKVRSMLQRRF